MAPFGHPGRQFDDTPEYFDPSPLQAQRPEPDYTPDDVDAVVHYAPDPMTGLANASTMGLTSRRGLGGRCGGSGVKSGRRRWSPWGLAGAFSGLDIASVPER